ncbi:MAG TPA: metalloregulator ArsR/SmtB family transcription factor [Methylomirabilota bacterium]|nr:metalloregulator ArsR/SmtB family transcription factor [Methylomirabilota bacterium]
MVNKQTVSAVFAALADPTRRRILERLATGGEARATALARPFRISLPAISRHLRVLEGARLIERRRKGRLHLIRARAAGLAEARRWMAHYAAGWDAAFDALDELLHKDREKGKRE